MLGATRAAAGVVAFGFIVVALAQSVATFRQTRGGMRYSITHRHCGRLPTLMGMLLLAACSGTDGTDGTDTSPIALSGADSNTTVAAAVNQELDVTLQTIGPGEYGPPSISSPAVRFLDVSHPSPQNPGGPRQLFRFRAASAGTVEVSIAHSDDDPPFSITVNVN